MRSLKALLVIAAAAVPVTAQNQPGAVWPNGNSPTAGSRNAFPWGSCGLRYQYIVDAAIIGRVCRIQDLFVAGDSSLADRLIEHTDIQINMGRTATTNAGTATAWNTNLPPANKTTVYRGPLDIFHENGAWRSIGLPNSYTFVGTSAEPNLCIEIITWAIKGCTAPSNFYFPRSAVSANGQERRAFRFNWINNQALGPLTGSAAARIGILCNDGSFTVVGAGCNGLKMAGSPPAWPKGGSPYTINLSGGAATSPALLFLGVRFPTPIDLTAANAPGCFWYVSPIVIFGTATNGSGDASRTLPLPNLPGVRAWFQWVNRNAAANGLGYTFSDYATMIIGA